VVLPDIGCLHALLVNFRLLCGWSQGKITKTPFKLLILYGEDVQWRINGKVTKHIDIT
jgi:hypothetical protein